MSQKFRKLRLDELNRISLMDFKEAEKIPLIVILDNIRSLHNVGSFFRTADAFRIRELWLTGISPVPPHREIQKTALGATESVVWKHFPRPSDACESLIEKSINIYPVEQSEGSTTLEYVKIRKNQISALVFGNEVDGVSDEFMNLAKAVIEIPQEGTKHSLNVSVTGGIVIWEFFKQLR